MKKLLFSIFLLSIQTTVSYAQVKIGNNPTTINTNSMLELESTDKGFLAPRVVIGSLNSVSPLTAATPPGMMVFSSGGAVPDGLYAWSGTKWLPLSATATTRNNYVLVKSAADFPVAVAGVITLVTGTLYEINGTITLTDKINMNGCTIKGLDRTNDKLIYTPASGELFTGNFGGTIDNVILSATGVGSKILNLDASADVTKTLIIANTFFFNSEEVGLVKGFAGTVAFTNVAFSNNKKGITFENVGDYIGINEFWVADNQNTYQKFVGTFNSIHKLGGDMTMLSVFSAVGLDITGITSITGAASLKNAMMMGNGTYVSGTFSNKWEVESYGLNTEKDDVASGNLYVTTPVSTVISTINTPVKVLGTTTSADLFRVTATGSNRLNYTGQKTRSFNVNCALSTTFIGGGTNKYFTFYIAKNGVVVAASAQKVRLVTSTDQTGISITCTVSLAPNDYLELWVANNTDATNINILNFNLAMH